MDAFEQHEQYIPGPDFGEVKKEALLDINLTDSTQLWLIQWPLNQLKAEDFEGKELTLKLHKDRNLGTFESSSGKSYEVVSVGAKESDATVFLPSESGSAVVGKISRRVCLVRYPDAKELQKPRGLNSFVLSNHDPKGFPGNTKTKISTPTKPEVSTHETQGSARKSGQGSTGTSSSHKKRKDDVASEGGSSKVTSVSENQTSESSLERSSLEKKKKKKI
ncbi:mediator-associated protein [Rhynchospora pubera]|uniref:Mediator-associated protein n=1 Tax=Rhynchospora pubera TaxID=906938 RepID=A0AAV8D775_9POAL|nr:mediator-associated protein [Rhynchospora pubera]